MKKIFVLLLSLALMSNLPATEPGSQKQTGKNIILDVDTSGDDLMAILYLLAQKDVDIKAITIVHGVSDVERGAEIVLRVLALTGRTEIPVVKGADQPMEGNNAFPVKWQPSVDHPFGLELPPHTLRPSGQNAEEVISSLLREYRGNISILALGPLTNIAKVLAKEPILAGYANEIVVSDGAVYVKGAINLEYPSIKNTVAGWNLWVDAKAADLVFGSDARITLVPLDLTAAHGPHPLLLKTSIAAQYNNRATGTVCKSLASVLNSWIPYYNADTKIHDTEEQAPVWDLVAAGIFCDTAICTEWQQQNIEIKTGDPDTDGQIVIVKGRNPNVRICLRGNGELFEKNLLETTTLPESK